MRKLMVTRIYKSHVMFLIINHECHGYTNVQVIKRKEKGKKKKKGLIGILSFFNFYKQEILKKTQIFKNIRVNRTL